MSIPSIGIIGGTGPQGKGLAYRLAGGGHESLTAVLISVNRRYKTHSGIQLTGLTPVN